MAQRASGINVRRRRVTTKQQREIIRKEEIEKLTFQISELREKLTEIISQNNIKSLTIVRMEVPCCGGLERAATEALKASGKFLPWRVVVISRDGEIIVD